MRKVSELGAEEIIGLLRLEPHREGGFFRESFRSKLKVTVRDEKGDEYQRQAGTSIYFLITPDSHSRLHSLKHDEIYYYLQGDPAEMVQFSPDGRLTGIKFGHKLELGEVPHAVVPAGHLQGLRVSRGGEWALFGVTVSPGFEYKDFELTDLNRLIKKYPEHKAKLEPYR